MRKVYYNGMMIDECDAKVSIYDSAMMFGDTIFEMTRSFNKKQFKLEEHIDRLYMSAKYLHLEIPISKIELIKAVNMTIEANEDEFKDDDEHRIMINVTRGILGLYQDHIDEHKGANIFIADFPLRWTTAGMGKLFTSGINAVIPSQRAIPSYLLEPKVKNRSRLHYLMANIEVSKIKGDNNWALLLTPDGFVAEGTGDNFFITKGNTLYTPKGNHILRGISRDYIAELANMKIFYNDCKEIDMDVYDVMEADEAFMTGTPFCMLPVTSINGVDIGNGKVGYMYKDLLESWSNAVEINIQTQIERWDSQSGSVRPSGATPYEFKTQDPN